ncbi:DUF305 domain-containing protein [Roseiarcaceae bacterium H3SJ34-1]|uniref:DUF305 domain-containing protein n=1 Tax=Terripilifer ovatus TaxID=3032367 RepID=UPI003AB98E68|nr:DUF305 domain-containing protein [Roseiarcaceae bacterium H3SJ34-1]
MKHFVTFGLLLAMATPVLGQSGSNTAELKAYEAVQSRMRDMTMKPMGEPDKDFAMMMIPHHQAAIDMAKIQIQYGKDSMLIKMANDVIASQEKEIETLKSWQSRNQK